MKCADLILAVCLLASCRPLITTSLEAGLFEKTLVQTPEPQLVDVRTFKEYSEGYIQGAVLMDIKDTHFDKQILGLDVTRPVFVYCRSGKRSMEAAAVLEKNKFTVVYNLDGGINAWKAKGKPVVIP
jgi:rhodanese-related sulfurtransferase